MFWKSNEEIRSKNVVKKETHWLDQTGITILPFLRIRKWTSRVYEKGAVKLNVF